MEQVRAFEDDAAPARCGGDFAELAEELRVVEGLGERAVMRLGNRWDGTAGRASSGTLAVMRGARCVFGMFRQAGAGWGLR